MSSKPKSLKKGTLNDEEKVFIIENRKEKSVEEISKSLNRSESSIKKYMEKYLETQEEKPVVVDQDPDFRTNKLVEQTGIATVMTGAAADVAKSFSRPKRSEFLREGY